MSKLKHKRKFNRATYVVLYLMIIAVLIPPSSFAYADKQPSIQDKVPIADHPYLTIHYSVNGNTVKLIPGMSKKAIDDLIGEGITYRSAGFDYDMHGELLIAYENDQAAYFSVENDVQASLNGLIGESSSLEDVRQLLGRPSIEETGEYLFIESDGSFQQVNPGEDVSRVPGSATYRLRFNSSYTDEIYSFDIKREDFRSLAEERVAALNSLEDLPAKPKPYTMWDLSVQTADDKRRIAIGMSKAEVDRQFGKPTSYRGLWRTLWYDYRGADVFYRKGKVAGIKIALGQDSTEIFRTPRGLGLLTNEAKMIRLYGKPGHISKGSIEYFFYKSQSGLRKLPSLPQLTIQEERPPTDQSYVISIILSLNHDEKLIDYLFISDFKFAYELQ
ncbi:hypothetical protein [Cohnella lupini]|uniref:Uncharacterized protein n=1 Tax=Cohnella lupini TaxID=1294267 RepID=A0A3D9ISN3_9BACL|nr:hypothetical protein [Cohnella lupini]RED64708.1 hypothetical protein DFP95_102129 [Cohnella lupini]